MNVSRPEIKVRLFGSEQLLDLAIHAYYSDGMIVVGDKQKPTVQELVGDLPVATYTSVDSSKLDGLLLLAEPDNSVDMFQFKQVLKHIDKFIVDRRVMND